MTGEICFAEGADKKLLDIRLTEYNKTEFQQIV